jgi:dihydrodipicolinate synthase/N-acetylneuraminate lyase
MDRDAVKQGFSGPIASVRPPFTRSGDIDYPALRRCIDFAIGSGATALLLTGGDSLYPVLRERDIAELTRATVDAAAGRVPVSACTGNWATAQAVEFAEFCRGTGADVLQLFLPFWYPGCTGEAELLAHYRAIAAVMPVMANSAELRRNNAEQGTRIAEALVETVDAVIAMKADCTGEFDRQLTARVGDRWAVFAGGQKSFHLDLWPYGCSGYLSSFVNFRPAVTKAYWQAISQGDVTAAAAIVNGVDRPFFQHIIAAPGGFDAAFHGIMEINGLAERWRRPPFYSLADDELAALAAFLETLPAAAC